MRECSVRYVWLLVYEVAVVAEVIAVVAPPTMYSIFLDKNPSGGNFALIIEPAVYNHLFFVTFLRGNFPPERWRRGRGEGGCIHSRIQKLDEKILMEINYAKGKCVRLNLAHFN